MNLSRPLWLALIGGILAAAATRAEEIVWRHFDNPHFPLEFTSTSINDGFVVIVFTYDDAGYVLDRVALTASHPAFATVTFASLKSAQVDTSKLDHDLRREVVRFDFRRSGFVVSLTNRDSQKNALSPYGDEIATSLQTVTEAQVDPALQTVATVLPEFPAALRGRGRHGSATVSFIVDAEGRVRVPAAIRATEPEFGEAALAAIAQWRFSPPHLGTLPVQVIAERTFSFGREKTEP